MRASFEINMVRLTDPASLEELQVPSDLISEVMAIAGSTHDDVLNIHKKAA